MDRYHESENEWCLPQRTGTRRYTSLLQDLFWRIEHLQLRIDRAANCARRRYDNARRLTPFCGAADEERAADAQKKDTEQRRKERALCRLVRHYGLYLSLYHVMSLSLACFWNALLYCTRAVSDAPIPLPASFATPSSFSSKSSSAKAEDYRQHIYARLHNNCKEFAAPAFDRLLNQIDSWLALLDRPVSVESLAGTVRIDVVLWTRQHVVAPILQCEKNADRAWYLLLNLCDHSRITAVAAKSKEATAAAAVAAASKEEVSKVSDDVALKTLENLTDAANGGEHVRLISRHAMPFQYSDESLVSVALPALSKSKVSAETSESSRSLEETKKHRTNELERLHSALKAIGG